MDQKIKIPRKSDIFTDNIPHKASECLNIEILPVSGGGFPVQLSGLEHLCESQFIPHLTLASSGGNVAAYIAAAADRKWPGIKRIARELNHKVFAEPWSSVSSLAMVIGFFQGNFYDKGSGVGAFLNHYFTEESIMKYEIWTGTYNKHKQKAQLFCNKSESILDMDCIDRDLTQSIEHVYANGNIEIIGQAGIASASIPGIVPPQEISGEKYVDGGVTGASPMSIIQEAILKHTRDGNMGLHLVYINSMDLSGNSEIPTTNALANWKQTASELIRFATINDRQTCVNLLRCHPGTMNKEEFPCNYENLQRVKLIRTKTKYSMIEIFPMNNYDINITNFTGNDIVKSMNDSYSNCRCRLWWLSSEEPICNDSICNIIDACKNCSSICDTSCADCSL
jgi:predicted acylesterase/phospholipase RssA